MPRRASQEAALRASAQEAQTDLEFCLERLQQEEERARQDWEQDVRAGIAKEGFLAWARLNVRFLRSTELGL